jgi:hypothetical protein
VFSATALVIAGTLVQGLFKLFVGEIDSDEREDIIHYVKYIAFDLIMNIAFIRGSLNLSNGILVGMVFFIRCLGAIGKVKNANLGRRANVTTFFRHFCFLFLTLVTSILIFKAHIGLIINVQSAASLAAFELLSILFSQIELISMFFVNASTIFYNNVLSRYDPYVIYPEHLPGGEYFDKSGNLKDFGLKVEDLFGESDDEGENEGDNEGDGKKENDEDDPDGTQKKNNKTEKLKKYEIKKMQQRELILQQREEIINLQNCVPNYYRYFFGYKKIWNLFKKISENQTMLETLFQLTVSFFKLIIYTYLVIKHYTVILPIYTIRPLLTHATRLVSSSIKMFFIFKVKNSMEDLFRTISTYSTSYLSEEEVCCVCLVDFGDDSIEAKEKVDKIIMPSFSTFFLKKLKKYQKNIQNTHKTTCQYQNTRGYTNNPTTDCNSCIKSQDKYRFLRENPIIDIFASFLSKKFSNLTQLASLKTEMQSIGHLSCGHYYHRACIGEWLSRDARCPMCRKSSTAKFTENVTVHEQREKIHADEIVNKNKIQNRLIRKLFPQLKNLGKNKEQLDELWENKDNYFGNFDFNGINDGRSKIVFQNEKKRVFFEFFEKLGHLKGQNSNHYYKFVMDSIRHVYDKYNSDDGDWVIDQGGCQDSGEALKDGGGIDDVSGLVKNQDGNNNFGLNNDTGHHNEFPIIIPDLTSQPSSSTNDDTDELFRKNDDKNNNKIATENKNQHPLLVKSLSNTPNTPNTSLKTPLHPLSSTLSRLSSIGGGNQLGSTSVPKIDNNQPSHSSSLPDKSPLPGLPAPSIPSEIPSQPPLTALSFQTSTPHSTTTTQTPLKQPPLVPQSSANIENSNNSSVLPAQSVMRMGSTSLSRVMRSPLAERMLAQRASMGKQASVSSVGIDIDGDSLGNGDGEGKEKKVEKIDAEKLEKFETPHKKQEIPLGTPKSSITTPFVSSSLPNRSIKPTKSDIHGDGDNIDPDLFGMFQDFVEKKQKSVSKGGKKVSPQTFSLD